jgi:PTH1 family peptidyl-tRNA hydrolase
MLFFKKEQNIDYMVVGLGNPGDRYESTRHNIGFMMIDHIADKLGARINKLKFRAMYVQTKIGDAKVILLKPQTYMNLSGDAVGEASRYFKVPAEHIIVISDDVSLPVGKMRIRRKGSAGGHNGLKSIIGQVGDSFQRIRVGVGQKPSEDYDLADWVLGRFSKDDLDILQTEKENVFEAVKLMIQGDTEKAMNRFN